MKKKLYIALTIMIMATALVACNAMNSPSILPKTETMELSNIVLETMGSLNDVNSVTDRLIQITRDGKISKSERKDLIYISKKLNQLSIAIDSLNLWIDQYQSSEF